MRVSLSSQIILKGSQREHPKNSVPVGKLRTDERGSVTCILRRKNAAPRFVAVQLTYEDFAANHGCGIDDITAVEDFATRHHFTVDRIHAAARTVTLSGNLHDLAQAFGASIELRKMGGKTYRTRAGHLSIPLQLDGIIIAVLGFDERPAAHTRHRVLDRAGQTSYTPGQVAQAYNFPSNQGSKQTIALIELGGGFNQSDLDTYWRQVGVAGVSVTAVGVDGTTNAPSGDPSSADGEVALEIEVVGAIASAARIAVYF
jgi:kumamolisin